MKLSEVGTRLLTMNRRRFLGGLSALALPAQAREPHPAQRREFVAPHMGTLWRLVFFENDEARARLGRDAAWDRLTTLNARLSDYLDDSELSRLSRDGRLASPSDDLRRVLTTARQLSALTEGAFDVTVGPLVRLWRTARREKRLPDNGSLAAARALVDWRAVEVTEEAAVFHTRGGRLDLGGIGKGFAQDEVLRLLRENHGIRATLIDAGGGVSVGDPPPGLDAWTATVASPETSDSGDSLQLRNQSLATSGDTRQFVEIDGVRYSHIVDPATGLGLTRRVQASVVAADGATADALATAFCVLGETKIRAWLKHHPLGEARVQSVTDDGRPRTWESGGFSRLTRGS
jgi:thiamine biosynthesis lipoprotein